MNSSNRKFVNEMKDATKKKDMKAVQEIAARLNKAADAKRALKKSGKFNLR